MDPFWALAAEFWWVAPAAVGAGAVGAVGLGRRSSVRAKRLAYDAARLDLQAAQKSAAELRTALKVARAEHAHAIAERAASRATSDDVAAARQRLRRAEHAAKTAAAEIRLHRARVNAARAQMSTASGPDQLPLARLQAAHDAVMARWLEYETDPAKRIAYPSMSDGRHPAMAAFLSAVDEARNRRPATAQGVTVAEFAAYRDAVAELERTFEAAERAARGPAGAADAGQREPAAWQDTAQQVISRTADALDRAADAAASAIAAWNRRERR